MFIIPFSQIDSVSAVNNLTGQVKSGKLTETQIPFSDMLQKSIQELEASEAVSQQDSLDMAMGEGGDLHTAMINSAILSTAVKTTVQLTSRAVSSYKEIMQMQI